MPEDAAAYREVFLSESAEYLQTMTDGLLSLESEPHDLEPVEVVFRGAHSLKGMAGAMGYAQTQELAHRMESLMATVRQRRQTADHSLIDLMLRALDVLRDVIAEESTGEAVRGIDDIATALARRTEAAEEHAVPGSDEGSLVRLRVTLDEDCVLKGVRAYMILKRLGNMGTVIDTDPSTRDIEDERFEQSFSVLMRTPGSGEAARSAVAAIAEVVDVTTEEVAEAPPPAGDVESRRAATIARAHDVPKLADAQTVRITVSHLDTMVNLVGELVIIRSRLARIAKDLDRVELTDALDAFGQVSADLQHEVMQTRMVPVGNIFQRFPRMVRDLARDLGKDASLELSGLDIELDRTVLDEIGDPVVHLLRNCVDHGIESPEERAAAGKPERGTILLSAEREREHVRLTVTDDGRGMDPEAIWSKAVASGSAESTERDAYTEEDLLLLACTPGLSTARQATKVSGRGVGMDVVKAGIERLGGTLRIASVKGEGTRVTLMLPLTLAIIQALLVASTEQVFALPLSAVDEIYGQDAARVTTVDGHPVVVLHDGEVVPLWRLDALLVGGAARTSPPDESDQIVVMRAGDEARAVAVRRLVGRQEIVIKPLPKLLAGVPAFAGATVLGDGSVALILDPRTLFDSEAPHGS